MHFSRVRRRRASRPAFEGLECRLALSVTIQFDYSYDSSGFFDANPAAKTILQEAGQMLGNSLTDSLAPILPDPASSNTWSEDFLNPSTGALVSVPNPTVPANTIVVYVGGAVLASFRAGEGGPGGFSSTGSSAWNSSVATRNATGMGRSWGGIITFNTSMAWSFTGLDQAPNNAQYDFLTIAIHELGHVLGLGTSDEWESQVDTTNNTFTGPHSVASYGGPVPLNITDETPDTHWASGLDSFGQEPALSITPLWPGQRKLFTSLDWAALQDLGWHSDQLEFTSDLSSVLNPNVPFSVSVSVVDPNGQLDATYNGPVSLSLGANPGTGKLSGVVMVNARQGVATFSGLSLDQIGVGYKFQASADYVASATSNSLTVGSATDVGRLAFTLQPPSQLTAGTKFGFTVAIQSPGARLSKGYSGPVTVSLRGGPAGATLNGPLTVNAINGVVSFSGLTLDQAGSGYQLVVSLDSFTAGLSEPISVSAGDASSLVLTNSQPLAIVAGLPFNLTFQVTDAFGNPRTDLNTSNLVTLSLLSNPSSDLLAGTTQAKVANGKVTFTGIMLRKAATNVTVKASTTGLSTTQPAVLNVVPSDPVSVNFVSQPASSSATGTGMGFVVELRDANGNLATNYTGTATVSLVANPGGSTLVGTQTLPVVGGQAVFSGLTLNYPGDGYRFQVTLSSGVTGFSNVFNVTGQPGYGGAAQSLAVVSSNVLWTVVRKRRKALGFVLVFNFPVDGSRALNAANYSVIELMRVKRATVRRQVEVRPSLGASSNTVQFFFVGSHQFAMGGTLTVKSSYPSGITSDQGNYLTSQDTTFMLLRNLQGIR